MTLMCVEVMLCVRCSNVYPMNVRLDGKPLEEMDCFKDLSYNGIIWRM